MNKVLDHVSPVLECCQLQKGFHDGGMDIHLFKETNFEISSGELVVILGQSGSGKSTLLHLLGGLEKPDSGEIYWSSTLINTLSEGKKSQLRNRHLGFVYQFHHLLPEFSAIENVAMPLLMRREVTLQDCLAQAEALLVIMGLQDRLHHKVGELSGGERQRIAIARAVVTKPLCVLADEPTGNLDKQTAEQVLEALLALQASLAMSFIIVTHDLAVAKRAHRVLRLENACLQADPESSSR